MKYQPINSPSAEQADAFEGRLALRLVAELSHAAERLPYDITERLRFSREQAVARSCAAQHQLETAPVLAAVGRAAVLGGPPTFWLRLASFLPLAVLMTGLVLIQQHYDHSQIAVAAEVDAALLADELPPAAYRDLGFTLFLQGHDSQ